MQPSGQKKSMVLCKCDCGKEFKAQSQNIRSSHTQSCGCLFIDRITKHGMHESREYKTWEMMIQRTTNKNSDHWKWYGARGITVCEEWRKFVNFYADMGTRPDGKSLDRMDNNGNYCKANCRWATQKEQMNNTRVSLGKGLTSV